MSDPNKKTPRNFQCREGLWQKFEQMARELECSVDYLINDAMKQYARQRGYMPTSQSSASMPPPPPSSVHGAPPPPPPPAASAASAPPSIPITPPIAAPPVPPPTPSAPIPTPVPPVAPPPTPVPAAAPHAPPPPPAPLGRTGAVPPPLSGGSSSASLPPPTLVRKPPVPPPPPAPGRGPGLPPPLPPGHGAAPAAAGAVLKVYCEGELVAVDKDRFIIGRGKQTSDLTIKDPNVSRQHAMIEFSGGNYYMVDMGSTNGVEYSGQRVQRKLIQEGDLFRICDHEIRCSFQ